MQDTLQQDRIKAKSYVFSVVVEPDEDRFHAYAPALDKYGATTWGNTEAEALTRIQEVVQMIVEELIEDGIDLPEGPAETVTVFAEPRVMVTI